MKVVPKAGIEPARSKGSRDFKSLASTISATSAKWTIWKNCSNQRRRPDLNRCITVLQTAPLATWVRRQLKKAVKIRFYYSKKQNLFQFQGLIIKKGGKPPFLPFTNSFTSYRRPLLQNQHLECFHLFDRSFPHAVVHKSDQYVVVVFPCVLFRTS